MAATNEGLVSLLTGIGDAIRLKNSTTDTMTLGEMASAITAIEGGGSTDEGWTRPDGWQNLDLIDTTDFVGMYATYEVVGNESDFLSIYGGSLTIDEIEVADEGTVSVIQSFTPTVSSNISRLDLSGLSAGFHTFRITGFSYAPYFAASGNLPYSVQRVLEYYLIGKVGTFTITGVHCLASRLTRHVKLDGGTYIRSVVNGGFREANDLEKVEFTNRVSFSTSSNFQYMFGNCYNLKEVDFSNLSLPKVTNISYMFQGCNKLKKVTFGNAFVSSPLTTTLNLFGDCQSLQSIDVSLLNTAKVTDMGNMFLQCVALEDIKFGENFSTASVTNMGGMFRSCSVLKELDLSMFTTTLVTSMISMFYNCYQLRTVNLSSFKTPKVTNFSYMFYLCRNLESLDLSTFDTTAATNFSYMFHTCISLKRITFGENFITSKATNFSWMFYQCYTLSELDLSTFDFTKMTAYSNWLYSTNAMVRITIGSGFVQSISFTWCTALTHDSLVAMLEALPEVSSLTFTLGSTNLAKLTDDEKAIATEKGWTLA